MKQNNASNNVYLKSSWDDQMKIGDNSNFHITRKHEHDKLVDFISNHNDGSLLVCGNRGVGKTSVIRRAINKTKEQNKRMLVATIDATSDAFSPDQKNSDSLIRQLVRSLYKVTKDERDIPKEIQNKTAELYIRSKASRVLEDQSITQKIISEKIFTIKGNIISSLLVIALSVLYFIIPSSLYPSWLLPVFVLASSGIFFSTLVYMKKTKYIQNTASRHYKSEDDHIKMQQDLGDLLSQIKKYHKILFVIDELDKIDDAHSIIKESKTLINQGNALFIFISDPEILAKIKQKETKEYTLFSQKLFIKRPLFQEMDKFLDKIIDWDYSQDAKSQYKNFTNYIEYVSHTDFFELYYAIRDHTIYEINGNIKMINISLDDMQRKKSILQSAVRWVYEKRHSEKQSQWQNNDKMLDELYRMTESLEETPISSEIVINGNKFTLGKYTSLQMDWSDKLAIDDLFNYFVKCGYLNPQNENNFIFTGDLREIDPDTAGIHIAEQRLFIKEFEEFMKLSIAYANVYNKWINDKASIFNLDTFHIKWNELLTTAPNVPLSSLTNHKDIFYGMKNPNSQVYTTQKLDQMTADIQTTNQLLQSYDLLENFLISLLCKNPSIVNIGTFKTLEGSGRFNIGDDSTKPFRNTLLKIQHFDTEIVLMLLHQPNPKIVRQLLNKEFEHTVFIICVEIENQDNPNGWKLLKDMKNDIKELTSSYEQESLTLNKSYVMNTYYDEQLENLTSALKLLHN